MDGDALALDLIMNHDGRGLGAASKRFKAALEPDDGDELQNEEFRSGAVP